MSVQILWAEAALRDVRSITEPWCPTHPAPASKRADLSAFPEVGSLPGRALRSRHARWSRKRWILGA